MADTDQAPAQNDQEKSETSEAPAPALGKRKKGKRSVPRGIVHIKSTFNNTLVTVTDMNGDVIAWASGGTMNFKGSRKGTPFAAQRAAQEVGERCKGRNGMREVDIRIQGPGPGAEAAVRGIQSSGVKVKSIEDVSPLPHNGCRPKKKRRI